MCGLDWVLSNWSQLGLAFGAFVSLLAHLRAVLPMPENVGKIVDVLAANYGYAKNGQQ